MDRIFEEIRKLAEIPSYSKHDRFVQGIINSIDEKIIGQDEMLPSVNKLIKELGFSRETIVKGYKDLISRGIVEAKNRLGYFVGNGNTGQTLNVALLMYNLDTFEEQFYRNFRYELGENVQLTTYFHHGNIEIFETILLQIKGKYGMYVVAPIPHPKTKALLENIPRNKFLMFDRYEQLDGEFNHITQEFGLASYAVFSKLAPKISQFDEFIFYHSTSSLDPREIAQSFRKFLKDFNIKGRIVEEYLPGSVEKGKVYFTLDNFALWQIMRDCKTQKLKPGKDLGVLSHNDEPAKEIIGITTFSADFSNMGKMAGKAVLSKEKIQLTVPMILFARHTL
ncbi:winged helix-turn-helix domain-containing protein [Mucilaginibacter sp. FT3.2]|uniref:winged helix-turn-helix domain-containing protein n=1 Tax=Mucilaginibacter sp. FT3.2 TaxID=2723090 RepID=UPI00160A06CF|nr:GntR family transcriptional regulator [Mucilaginibacter sp. FT3.2]MBB6232894.1 DNA-binding transcriptional regulator YhcF (GntR family) [Mucilaginibacter sp. FT3.2]